MWCKPRSSGSPMYIPGRFRTASKPSSLSICAASYFCNLAAVTRSRGRDFSADFPSSGSTLTAARVGIKRAYRKRVKKQLIISRDRAAYLHHGLEVLAHQSPRYCGRLLRLIQLCFCPLDQPLLRLKIVRSECVSKLCSKRVGSSG